MDPALKPTQKKDWILTEAALAHLLSWLDDGPDSRGERFLEMRRRLVAYFDRKNCLNPDELADESLNRIARRLEEAGKIESESPAKYCYIVARFVFMEHLRQADKEKLLAAELERQRELHEAQPQGDVGAREKLLNCLERCTRKLEPVSRNIISRYYLGKERARIENRRALARGLGITMNALTIRACRIRDKLESCVKECLN
jgi:DNA-directed RNA polymerase specialized sigma24 family protein